MKIDFQRLKLKMFKYCIDFNIISIIYKKYYTKVFISVCLKKEYIQGIELAFHSISIMKIDILIFNNDKQKIAMKVIHI